MLRLDACILDRQDLEKQLDNLTNMFVKKIYVSATRNLDTTKQCNMPSGSEGSLDYTIIVNPDINHCNFCQVAFWGDLRDYGVEKAVAEFPKWIHSFCTELIKKDIYTIRNLIFCVEPEDCNYSLVYTVEYTDVDCTQFKIISSIMYR